MLQTFLFKGTLKGKLYVEDGQMEYNTFQNNKRNLVSPSGHVKFYLLHVHKHQKNTKPFQLQRKAQFNFWP